jgi:NAD(P)H-hydrate repair Nnr-like enzyme with NAD(P)H-hydrate epimerase domain
MAVVGEGANGPDALALGQGLKPEVGTLTLTEADHHLSKMFLE